MSYQALLFCPDEKTARTVTQVLGELEFNVVPCTEPFAAVKKLMSERFDAVVVDCDNEQNATLLFKSARNAPMNQSALAVAVVEGQAGVAKAFRIGANLVLTKPINVEQAKGTLRVARGLLRKNEGAKASGPVAASTAKPLAATPVPTKPVSEAAVPASAPIPIDSVAAITPEPALAFAAATSQPQGASVSPAVEELKAESQPSQSPAVSNPAQPANSPQSVASKIIASSAATPARPISTGSAASAPAPALETKSNSTVEEISAPGTEGARQFAEASAAISQATKAHPTPAASLTFGGTIDSAKPESKSSKTKLIAAVAIVIIAVASYAAWMKFGSSATTSSSIAPTAQPSVPAPARSTSTSTTAVSAPPIAESKLLESDTADTAKSTSTAKSSTHPVKIPQPESSKPAPVEKETAENFAPAARPMVIKAERSKPSASSADSVVAPALSVAAVPSGEAMPNLLASNSAPTPVLQKMVISQGVSRGLLIKQVQPTYPRNALDLRIEGSVQLMATVTKDGNISEVKILSGDKNLARAAADAVKQWKYKPYLLNGEPVDIQTQITVNFKLPR